MKDLNYWIYDMWIVLTIYLIQIAITVPFYAIISYVGKREKGRRKAIIGGIKGSCIGLIPVITLLGLVVFIIYGIHMASQGWRTSLKTKYKSWINNDPTSPKNLNNPNFQLPEKKKKKKKKKKEKPVEDRFEIMDL